jgi:hypothetical protein
MKSTEHPSGLKREDYDELDVVLDGKTERVIYKSTYERETLDSPWVMIKQEKLWPTPGTSTPTT